MGDDANDKDLRNLPAYSYQPLHNATNLRVLTVRSAPEDAVFVDCELKEYSSGKDDDVAGTGIVRRRDYEAVSWCWGEAKTKRSIRINDNGRATTSKSINISTTACALYDIPTRNVISGSMRFA